MGFATDYRIHLIDVPSEPAETEMVCNPGAITRRDICKTQLEASCILNSV